MGRLTRGVKRALHDVGFEVRRIPRSRLPWERDRGAAARLVATHALTGLHLGCGAHLLPPPWLNVDVSRPPVGAHGHFARLDLTAPLPFPDGAFRYAFCEDFIEHLSQADALTVICEVYRVLAPGGVFRVSTPSLEGVLRRHYRESSHRGARVGAAEAFDPYGHLHFFSRASFELVARHVGFVRVEDVTFGASTHPTLCGLDTRDEQRDLNLNVEATR